MASRRPPEQGDVAKGATAPFAIPQTQGETPLKRRLDSNEMIVMGRVAAPYGVKGWIKVTPFTGIAEALTAYAHWWLGGADGWEEMEVAEARRHGAHVIAQLAGCGDRSEAAKLRGRQVAVPRAALPDTAPDEYYWADLVGLEVVNAEGQALGSVSGLFSNGAHDVMRVGAGTHERLVPFVPAVVRKVDLAAGRIEVDWGLDW